MAEREVQKVKETEAKPASFYEWSYAHMNQWKERAVSGQVVVRGKDIPRQQSRQGHSKWYLHPLRDELVTQEWLMFQQDIHTHSGRHRHQGGLAIFVIEGKGWTTVDGVRFDWEAGDLILLPIKFGGCEHQHFNGQPGQPCKWLAMIFLPMMKSMSSELIQKEVSPDYAHV